MCVDTVKETIQGDYLEEPPVPLEFITYTTVFYHKKSISTVYLTPKEDNMQ